MTLVQPPTFRVAARNLPEHARNAIHTDAGAQAAGFPRALVAGVTTYAYLTHVPTLAWGLDWISSGAAEVRLHRPVFEHDPLECVARFGDDDSTMTVEAFVNGDAGEAERPRAVLHALRSAAPTQDRPGETLQERTIQLTGEWGDYGRRAGDPLALYADGGIVHPAVWPSLANHIVHTQLARGPWVHTRSVIRHHGAAMVGASAIVRAVVVDRFFRNGERAVLDVRIEIDGALVASLEHEAIIDLAARPPA